MKLVLTMLLISVSTGGCSPTEGPSTDPVMFQIKVDSLAHPATIVLGDTADMSFFGVVGPDGCHSFSHFLVIRQPAAVNFVVWGKRSLANACPAVMVYLDGKEYTVVATQEGWYFINIHQPDGTILRDSLIVN